MTCVVKTDRCVPFSMESPTGEKSNKSVQIFQIICPFYNTPNPFRFSIFQLSILNFLFGKIAKGGGFRCCWMDNVGTFGECPFSLTVWKKMAFSTFQ